MGGYTMIELKNVTKSYNDTLALDSIDINISQGELVVFKGASGSGKSTLLSLIAALHKPSSGEVLVDNEPISKLTDKFAAQYRQKNIGFIFQKYNLIPQLSVQENILIPLIPQNLDPKFVQEQLRKVMDRFHIDHKKDQLVQNLSGGEQQRVAIARAHINDPKIIIADEPTANLDQKLSLKFIDILQELQEENKTIIVATHDPLFFDLQFIDKTIQMEHGKVISCS
jgi:putative ABC transport system ATP-binding protein